jgi:hypothetical protein
MREEKRLKEEMVEKMQAKIEEIEGKNVEMMKRVEQMTEEN